MALSSDMQIDCDLGEAYRLFSLAVEAIRQAKLDLLLEPDFAKVSKRLKALIRRMDALGSHADEATASEDEMPAIDAQALTRAVGDDIALIVHFGPAALANMMKESQSRVDISLSYARQLKAMARLFGTESWFLDGKGEAALDFINRQRQKDGLTPPVWHKLNALSIYRPANQSVRELEQVAC